MALTVVQLLPALHGGGVERGTLEIAAALVAAGHRSLVVSAGGPMVADLVAAGSEHVELPIGEKRPWVLRTVRPLRHLLRKVGADIVHARSRLPAWISWFALRQIEPRPRWVTTLHGLNSVSRYSHIMTRGDAVIAVSNSCREYWQTHYPDLDPRRVTVIHRGIDPQAFPFGHQPDSAWTAALGNELGIEPGVSMVCLPGRLSRGKGHRDLIDAVAGLDEAIELVFPGPGSRRYRGELERYAGDRGLADRVHFLEHRRDVREIMAASSVVACLSTKPESFGRTAVEALALGRPVIGYDHGGIGEVLNAIYPWGRVTPGNLDGVRERLRQVLTGAAPPVPDQQPFRLQTLCEQTLALYQELAGPGDRSPV